MLIITKQGKQSKTKVTQSKVYSNEIETWLNAKGYKLVKIQSDFLKEVNEIIGKFTYVNIELDQKDFNIYLTLVDHQRRNIDNAFRNTAGIEISKPVENCSNLIKLTFKV